MNIIKEYRKQKKSFRRFMISMSLIFFILPVILYITKQTKMFFIIYLLIIETLIVFLMWMRISGEMLSFTVKSHRIIVNNSIGGRPLNLNCEKITIVDIEKNNNDINIVIVTTSKFRNKKFMIVDDKLLKKRTQLSKLYLNIKKSNLETKYYYTVIKSGGYKKYALLDSMYKNCLKAEYTDDAIESIRIYRNS